MLYFFLDLRMKFLTVKNHIKIIQRSSHLEKIIDLDAIVRRFVLIVENRLPKEKSLKTSSEKGFGIARKKQEAILLNTFWLKKTKLVLNSLTACYLKLDHNNNMV